MSAAGDRHARTAGDRHAKTAGDRPVSDGVSIVVPVHGRMALTRRCLDTLLATLLASDPAAFEVIVVDDASTDGTAELLDSYGEAIRRVTLNANRGYAGACNEGAAIAKHEALLFLNNDTEPWPGWLEAMRRYANAHPAAAIVGAKLLYPTGAVQHAGVAIGQDRYPHNLYAGLPAEHPAVNRSRRLQAVTGACMLVQRELFERAGGFDTAYSNSLEDVDLCLRIGALGGEVHYCHEAVLTHLESASRGRDDRFAASVVSYRQRWRDRVIPDDLAIYAQDGLIEVEYRDTYPLRMSLSPQLAALAGERQPQIESLLEAYAGQVADLMAEVVRLSALAGVQPMRLQGASANERQEASAAQSVRRALSFDHRAFLAHANALEEQVCALQRRIEDASTQGSATPDGGTQPQTTPTFTASRSLGYRHLVSAVRAAVAKHVPQGASVLVVSRGDHELLRLGAHSAAHFPQDADGRYLGHHPADSEEAIARLQESRKQGAGFLVLPASASWWLEHYEDFAEHLRAHCPSIELDVCSIYDLRGEGQIATGQRSVAGSRSDAGSRSNVAGSGAASRPSVGSRLATGSRSR